MWEPDAYGAFVDGKMMYYLQKVFHQHKLFVGTHTDVARILVDASFLKAEDYVVEWRVQGETGPNPKDGYGKITIRDRPEGLLDVQPVNQS